ncbi:MAG: P-loop NTPase fold protein [Candidatus Onthovivens sp.]|nr:KAP family NTPase [Mollicutes bacterium]MDY4937228.1 P-loop NTPase fold protein [Candidatus Onthovivens sp.]
MNKDELLNVLLNFYKSDENVILIDGKWGSGKTYLINEFIHNFNKLPVYYVSMLGSRNVNDINTNLYIEINKHSSINQIVPSSINPLKIKFNESTSLDFILKRNHDANAIIIFDDFERYSSSDYDSFLSYVSNLVLFKAKVIVVSNLKELGGGEKLIFDEFKEKIFDHIYKAELFTNNVIDIKLHEFSKFVKSDSLNILKSNIRLVDKLYFLLKSINKDNVFNYLNNEIKSEIIDISTVFLSIYYNQSKLNYSQEKLMRADINVSNFIKEYINDEDSYWEIIHIYEYFINKKETIFKDNLIDLIVYLYLSYVYVDNEKLFKFLKNI